jgi:hypothetical protein
MAETPLTIAQERLRKIEQEVADLRKFIAMYQELAGASPVANAEQGPKTEDSKPHKTKPVRPRSARIWKPAEVVKMAEVAMKEAGKPLTRGELVDALEKKNVTIGGTDKPRNMGTIVWRSHKFVNIPDHGYWPKGLDCPAFGYSASESGNDEHGGCSN